MTKAYIVTITNKCPAAAARPTTMWVKGRNKRDAISKARLAWRSRHDRPAIYTAEEA